MKEIDVYLFGQILGTHSFLLKDGFLKPDEYSEIKEQYFLPGGETGTAATVLNSLGVTVRIDGTWIGTEVAPMCRRFQGKNGWMKSQRIQSAEVDRKNERGGWRNVC